uniref:Cytochrome b5 protein n=1 Tax=Paracoccidioides brasiliensis TaxID=121759 RepID=Q5K667_PARBR|nr:cytochrome b5 protein [Paracoccidioides brasiliensis]
MSGIFSKDAVASHNKSDNLWVVIDEDVYDLTKFQDEHPGGKKSMQHFLHLFLGTFVALLTFSLQ